MSRNTERAALRRGRQAQRRAFLTPAEHKANETAAKMFIKFGCNPSRGKAAMAKSYEECIIACAKMRPSNKQLKEKRSLFSKMFKRKKAKERLAKEIKQAQIAKEYKDAKRAEKQQARAARYQRKGVQ